MALTQANFQTLQSQNTGLTMELYRDTNGVDLNRIVFYRMKSTDTAPTVHTGTIDLTGVQFQQCIYVVNGKRFFKNITPTLTT